MNISEKVNELEVEELTECPECGIGKLIIIRSSVTMKRFIGCTNYYNGCNASSPIFQKASVRIINTNCKICKWPICLFRYNKKQKWIKQCTNIVLYMLIAKENI